MARIAEKAKRRPSDLTDEEWQCLAPLVSEPGHQGRPRAVECRAVINAARYLVRSGCGWRMLPLKRWPWIRHIFADGAGWSATMNGASTSPTS